METIKHTRRWTLLFAIAAIVSLANSAVAADEVVDVELRVSESSYHARDGRNQSSPNRISTDAIEPGTRVGRRSLRPGGDTQQKTAVASDKQQRAVAAGESRSPNTDFWFFAADVELFADADLDGYYHGIDLLFDADTVYTAADVYAVVYLSLEGGPWLEYAETETFTIFGATSDDEYVIASELLAGYPTGSYDLLIELFDTFDNSFVAEIGPENTSELALLPLEDADRDTPPGAPQTVIVSQGGGGAAGWLTTTLLALLTTTLLLRRRYQSPRLAASSR